MASLRQTYCLFKILPTTFCFSREVTSNFLFVLEIYINIAVSYSYCDIKIYIVVHVQTSFFVIHIEVIDIDRIADHMIS